MLEHLSSLRRKSSEKASTAPSTNSVKLTNDEKEVNDVYKVSGKSRNNIFKSLISDNGATNIFSNLLKCPEMHSNSNSNYDVTSPTSYAGPSSHTNGNAKQNNDTNHQQIPAVECNNRKSDQLDVHPSDSQIMKKRNSVVKSNGEFLTSRELSPIPNRVHRKSCHDIRLMRNQLVGENGIEVGKSAVVKPLKTKNIATNNETLDMLYPNSTNVS